MQNCIRKDSFICVLDSRNATSYYNGTYNSEVTFEMKNPIVLPRDAIYMTWSIQSFTCPISWYLINETNNLFSITANSVTYNIYIPYGNYNSNTFVPQFATSLGNNFSLTINSINNIYTITNNIGSNFSINSTSTIYQILGLKKGVTYYSTNYTVTCPFMFNFSGLNSINIICENIKSQNLDSHNGLSPSSIISSIPVNNSQGGIIFFQKYNDFEFDIKDNVIDYFDILITDDIDNKINFNNQHWNLTIQINFIRQMNYNLNENFSNILTFGKNNTFDEEIN